MSEGTNRQASHLNAEKDVTDQMRIVPDKEKSENGRTDMVFLMPVIHWETDIARLQQHYVMADVDKQVKSDNILTDAEIHDLPCSIDEKLLRKYSRHQPPLHVRRTLDQSYHPTLDDTKLRDRDQVVLRDARKKISQGYGSIVPRVLMVDQCWLWVIGSMNTKQLTQPGLKPQHLIIVQKL